jgi:hypothetical protein
MSQRGARIARSLHIEIEKQPTSQLAAYRRGP